MHWQRQKNFSETPYKSLLPRQYMRGHDASHDNTLASRPHRKEKIMENRTPKNRYNSDAATDSGKSAAKPDALKLLETAMDKRAGDIAQTATDMFRFMSMASAMLPNMELDVGVFRLKIDDEGVFFEIRYPDDFRKKLRRDSGVSDKMPENYDDDEEGLIYDGD